MTYADVCREAVKEIEAEGTIDAGAVGVHLLALADLLECLTNDVDAGTLVEALTAPLSDP